MLHHGSNCPLSRAMDGRIMRRGIISSCQSAATSEIVKRCCSSLCKQRYSKYSDLYLYLTITLHWRLPNSAKNWAEAEFGKNGRISAWPKPKFGATLTKTGFTTPRPPRPKTKNKEIKTSFSHLETYTTVSTLYHWYESYANSG